MSKQGRFSDLLSLEVSRAARELPGSAARELLRENCSESSHDSSHDSDRGVPAVLQLGVRSQLNGNLSWKTVHLNLHITHLNLHNILN